MKYFLTFLTAICLSLSAIGQTNFWLANCNDARITLDNSIPIDNNMYFGGTSITCNGFNSKISGPPARAVYHELQRKVGGNWIVEKSFRTNYRTIHYNNLVDGGTYRVFTEVYESSGLITGPYSNPCAPNGTESKAVPTYSFTSNILEIGQIDVSTVNVFDFIDGNVNNVFCLGDPIILNASANPDFKRKFSTKPR